MWTLLTVWSWSWAAEDGPEPPVLRSASMEGGHEIAFLTDRSARIELAPDAGVFVVQTGTEWILLDRRGAEVARAPQKDRHRFAGTPFAQAPDGVIDLTRIPPSPAPIASAENATPGKLLREDVWNERFRAAWTAAEVVLYGERHDDVGRFPVYLRTDGVWTVFYLRSGIGLEDIGIGTDKGRQLPAFPQKAPRMVLLGDADTREIADVPYSARNTPPTGDSYLRPGTLEMTRWKKTGTFGTYTYTPIAHAWMGVAWYRLTVGPDTLRFREIAVRHRFGGGKETRLRWYTVPEQEPSPPDVSFLAFMPNDNTDHLGSGGLYVIRPR